MNTRIASLEKTAEPDLRFRHKPAAYQRGESVAPSVHEVTATPQVAGNLVVQRLLHSGAIQLKLTVSHPNDAYEQEAR